MSEEHQVGPTGENAFDQVLQHGLLRNIDRHRKTGPVHVNLAQFSIWDDPEILVGFAFNR